MNQLTTQQLIDYTRNTIATLVSDKRSEQFSVAYEICKKEMAEFDAKQSQEAN